MRSRVPGDSADSGAHPHRHPVADACPDPRSDLNPRSATDGNAGSNRGAADARRDSDRHPRSDAASAPNGRTDPGTDGDPPRGPATVHGNNGAITHSHAASHSPATDQPLTLIHVCHHGAASVGMLLMPCLAGLYLSISATDATSTVANVEDQVIQETVRC